MIRERMQKEIIHEIHNKGHNTVAKIEAIIKQNFYTPKSPKADRKCCRKLYRMHPV